MTQSLARASKLHLQERPQGMLVLGVLFLAVIEAY
ncbi:MAG: hypothetical protein RL659_763 [Pseudomonadota bacterium]|jgi:hypothetical protein